MAIELKVLLIGITIIILLLVFLFIIFPYICYRMTFLSKRNRKEDFSLKELRLYKDYKDEIIDYAIKGDALPYKDVSIKSNDGLTLYGKYYEYAKDAPIELLFHGYKGNARRDLSAGIYRCFSLKHSAFIVDHRASGRSDGKTISFGINEVKDLLLWVNYIVDNINKNAKILLGGISMGAATVMMAADKKMPNNVKGIIADCGYTSPKEIIKHYVKNMKLAPKLVYPFIKLGAKIFGRFDLEEDSPIKSLKNALYPVLFIHGDIDDFVPYSMSIENYNVCKSKKKLVTIKNADHGLAYLVDKSTYVKEIEDFFFEELKGE